MFIVEARTRDKLWISGTFLRKRDKDAFLERMPAKVRRSHRVVELPRRRYPLYIIEAFGRSLECVTKRELLARLRRLSRVDAADTHTVVELVKGSRKPFVVRVEGKSFAYATVDGVLARIRRAKCRETDNVYFIYYAVTEDFAPDEPGTDRMGCLNHVHVDDDFLRRFARTGRV